MRVIPQLAQGPDRAKSASGRHEPRGKPGLPGERQTTEGTSNAVEERAVMGLADHRPGVYSYSSCSIDNGARFSPRPASRPAHVGLLTYDGRTSDTIVRTLHMFYVRSALSDLTSLTAAGPGWVGSGCSGFGFWRSHDKVTLFVLGLSCRRLLYSFLTSVFAFSFLIQCLQ
jgi:hypothetical protein